MISLFNPLFRSGLGHRIPKILLESKRLTSQVEARSLTTCSWIEDANRMIASNRKAQSLTSLQHRIRESRLLHVIAALSAPRDIRFAPIFASLAASRALPSDEYWSTPAPG